jgi:hypothetical protein
MRTRNKFRFTQIVKASDITTDTGFGWMRGSAMELGDIVGPVWDGEPWDAELGIAYRGDNRVPVFYTGTGTETTDDRL